jgi:hypothetical protein
MFTNIGAKGLVLTDENSKGIQKLATLGDGDKSIWFVVFEGDNKPKKESFVVISEFKIESIPIQEDGKKQYPVNLYISKWIVVDK